MSNDKRLKMPDTLCQFTLKWTYQGQQCRNVLYMQRWEEFAHELGAPEAWTNDSATDQASQLVEWYKNRMQDLTSNKATLQGVDWVWNEAIDDGPLHEGSDDGTQGPWTGNLTGDPFPTNVTIAVKLGTGFGGRAGHGRFYYVGLTNDQVDAPNFSQMKSGSVTDLNTALNSFKGDIELDDVDGDGNGTATRLVVASFIVPGSSSGGSTGVLRSPTTAQLCTSLQLHDAILDSQRRRLPGRGL